MFLWVEIKVRIWCDQRSPHATEPPTRSTFEPQLVYGTTLASIDLVIIFKLSTIKCTCVCCNPVATMACLALRAICCISCPGLRWSSNAVLGHWKCCLTEYLYSCKTNCIKSVYLAQKKRYSLTDETNVVNDWRNMRQASEMHLDTTEDISLTMT